MNEVLEGLHIATADIGAVRKHVVKALAYERGAAPPSDEFCGIAIHGRPQPFTLEEHEASFLSFRFHSSHSYPIYLFCNPTALGEVKELQNRYERIVVLHCPEMRSIADYDRFVINDLFRILPARFERTLTFHSDGFLLRDGWEEFVTQHDLDYVGAPWMTPVSNVLTDTAARSRGWQPSSLIGNGGFCFRRRSKCLEVLRAIPRSEVNWRWNGSSLPDDVYFSVLGFGFGIFRPVDLSVASKWASEPLSSADTFGFHRTCH